MTNSYLYFYYYNDTKIKPIGFKNISKCGHEHVTPDFENLIKNNR